MLSDHNEILLEINKKKSKNSQILLNKTFPNDPESKKTSQGNTFKNLNQIKMKS